MLINIFHAKGKERMNTTTKGDHNLYITKIVGNVLVTTTTNLP